MPLIGNQVKATITGTVLDETKTTVDIAVNNQRLTVPISNIRPIAGKTLLMQFSPNGEISIEADTPPSLIVLAITILIQELAKNMKVTNEEVIDTVKQELKNVKESD